MTTPREFAEDGTRAFFGILHISPEAAQDYVVHLLSSAPAVLYSFEATGDYAPTFVSNNLKLLFGYEPGEYMEDPDFWRRRVHPDDLSRVESEFARVLEEGRQETEYRFRRKDGAYSWVSDEQHVIRDENGEPVEIVGSWSDITARKEAEKAMVAAQERLNHLVSSSPAVIYSFQASDDFAPTFVSENIRELLGYEPREYLEDPEFWRRSIHPEDIKRVLGDMPRLFDEGHLSQEYRFRCKDGNYCWVSDELRLIRDANGEPIEVVGAWTDVTAQRRVGEAVVKAQNRLNHLLSSAPAVIYSFEAAGDYAPLFVSENLKDVLGYERREYLEDPDFWRQRVHPDDIPEVDAAFPRLFEKGRLYFEYRFRHKDGGYVWVSDDWHLIRDKDGEPVEVVGSWSDISARKQAEEALHDSEQRLGEAIESISEGFALFDPDDKLLICNEKYGELLYPDLETPVPGTPYEEIIRSAVENGLIEDAKGRAEAWIAERLAKHRDPTGSLVQRRSNGRWIQANERKTENGGTVAVYSDITELKQHEEELAHKSDALEQLSNQLAKYLSPQVYESIFSGKQVVKVASRRKKLTIFFSDIVGFTETADRLESEDLTQLLNHYLTEMSQIALAHGATIDKYVGDAIMIFFGDPETRGIKADALACVKMAIDMRKRMHELQSVWRASGIEKPLQIRIGINSAYCTVGNFGSEDRMDYTIIGSSVNLASRLETAATRGEILVSYETYALVKDKIQCEERGHIDVKGIAYPVATYEVIDTYDSLGKERQFIHEDHPNLNLNLDLDAMSAEERSEAAAILRRALDRLSTAVERSRLKQPAKKVSRRAKLARAERSESKHSKAT